MSRWVGVLSPGWGKWPWSLMHTMFKYLLFYFCWYCMKTDCISSKTIKPSTKNVTFMSPLSLGWCLNGRVVLMFLMFKILLYLISWHWRETDCIIERQPSTKIVHFMNFKVGVLTAECCQNGLKVLMCWWLKSFFTSSDIEEKLYNCIFKRS